MPAAGTSIASSSAPPGPTAPRRSSGRAATRPSNTARPWRDWFNSGGKAGVEPPQDAKDLFDLYDKWQQTVMGTPEFKAAAIKVHDQIAKVLWVIGIIGEGPQPLVIKTNLENVLPADTQVQGLVGRRRVVLASAVDGPVVLHQLAPVSAKLV